MNSHLAAVNQMCDNPACVECKGWRAYHRAESARNSLQRHINKCMDCQTRPPGSYCWVGRKIWERHQCGYEESAK